MKDYDVGSIVKNSSPGSHLLVSNYDNLTFSFD